MFGNSKDALFSAFTQSDFDVSYFLPTCIHNSCLHIFVCRFGPLRQHWCMRFESKNAQIKRFVTSSFRNVPLTVSVHHQQWICHQLTTHPRQSVSNFLYSGDEIISGNELYLNHYVPIQSRHIDKSIIVHVGSVTEVHEHVDEILSLCGETLSSGEKVLELLR